MENPPSPFKHPPMFEIVGCEVSSDEINRRLTIVFDALPRLWNEYATNVVPYVDQGSVDSRLLKDFLPRLSLRPEAFLEWDTDYFNEQLAEIIQVARERGSHDLY